MTSKVLDRFESDNGAFRIRVTAYYESPGFVSGAYYVFESAAYWSEDWRPIMTFHHDDPVLIPRDQIRFVRRDVGYVFMGWLYAVTTDAGASGSQWKPAASESMDWAPCAYGAIADVTLAPDGRGIMHNVPGCGSRAFQTRDYGRSWIPNE
ncbi:MAG: hypothetical protein M3Y03_01195 [Verrucomicrobiota bacterium]|nr:hypothetical protein [Verrucomicrobiota bacterium]